MSDDPNVVSYREFARVVDELKTLMIQLTEGARKSASDQHQSVRTAMTQQDARLDLAVERIMLKIDIHKKEDDAVEKRVSSLEERQSRLMWVGFAVIPSALAAWEAIKVKYLGH